MFGGLQIRNSQVSFLDLGKKAPNMRVYVILALVNAFNRYFWICSLAQLMCYPQSENYPQEVDLQRSLASGLPHHR